MSIYGYEKLLDYIENVKQQYPVDELFADGKVFYMNKVEGTEYNWKHDFHTCEFVIYYPDGWGFLKFTVKKGGAIDGFVFYPNGNSPAKKLPTKSMSAMEAEELCALLIKVADKRGLFNKPLDELDMEAEVEDSDIDVIADKIVEEDEEEEETDDDGNPLPNKRFHRELVGKNKDDDKLSFGSSYASVLGRGHNSAEYEDPDDSGYSSYLRRFGSSSSSLFKSRNPFRSHSSPYRRRNFYSSSRYGMRNYPYARLLRGKNVKVKKAKNVKKSKRPFTSAPVKMPPELMKYAVKKASKVSAKKINHATTVSARMVSQMAGKNVKVVKKPVKKAVKKVVKRKSIKKDNISKLENSMRRMI